MTESAALSVPEQHLAKVRIDFDDCNRALKDWCITEDGDHNLHIAIEALLRATSTLALAVETQQMQGERGA